MHTASTIIEEPHISASPMYLRSNVKIEPLACGWYAWTHLVSPAQRAMNVAFRHLPLLQSFVQNPAVHLAAANDSSLFGGPFVQLTREQLPEAKALIERMLTTCAPLIRFAKDFRQFDEHVQSNAKGYSLSEFYDMLPESLTGLVEILYDLNNHPRLRLFEELLYREGLVPDDFDIMLSDTKEDERPFFMSTPRLPPPGATVLKMALADPRLDQLMEMRIRAAPLESMAQTLSVPRDELARFARFFTDTPPRRSSPEYSGDGVRIRYFGHACVLIQTAEIAILCDPLFAWDTESNDGRLTFADLPDRIDYLVLSHNHQDHCAPEMLLQLRHRVGQAIVPPNNSGSLADPSMKLLLEHIGFRDVRTLNALEQLEIPGGKITGLPFPGEHVDLEIHSRQGIHIEIKNRRLCFLVDSDGRDPTLYRRIAKIVGRQLDALFIGMECHGAPLTWLYGPLLTRSISRRDDESRRLSGLDSTRAVKSIAEFDVKRMFVYAMGQEPWLPYIMGLRYTPDSVQLREVAKFLEICQERGIAAEHLYLAYEITI